MSDTPFVDGLKNQFSFMGNCPPTPPLSYHFAIDKK